MGIIITPKERIKMLERENNLLREELSRMASITEYIAICDYPEVFEEDEPNE